MRLYFSVFFGAMFLSASLLSGDADIARIFKERNAEGTIVIEDDSGSVRFVHNEARAAARFSPASTFKILNTLIALEEKAVADEAEVIKWDGVRRQLDDWNKDQNLATAFKGSCVWFYKELARRVGGEKYKDHLRKTGYGNMSVGEDPMSFWLDGSLQVSALEQIRFLKDVRNRRLPFSKKSYDILGKVMLHESSGGARMYAKTGWLMSADPQYGWFVGWVERDGGPWYFAVNIEMRNKGDAALRLSLAKEALRAKGLY